MRLKEEENFISDKILSRWNLLSHLDSDDTIRLTWIELSEAKTHRTRFRKISDHDIRTDIAIGECADNNDEDEHDISETTQQLTLGGRFCGAILNEILTETKNATIFEPKGWRQCLQKCSLPLADFNARSNVTAFLSYQQACNQIGSVRKRQSQGSDEVFLTGSKRPRFYERGG